MREINKQADFTKSPLEEIASINSMNSMKTKTKQESEIVTNTSMLERKTELQEKIVNEGRKACKYKIGLVLSV